MPKFRIYYTITNAGYDEVEACTLEEAIEKWDKEAPSERDGGTLEYDPYTQEYHDWEESLKKEQENKNG
jgi:hypothetical protein